jgi:hypothetical protein
MTPSLSSTSGSVATKIAFSALLMAGHALLHINKSKNGSDGLVNREDLVDQTGQERKHATKY